MCNYSPRRNKREEGDIFEDIMTDNFPYFIKILNL